MPRPAANTTRTSCTALSEDGTPCRFEKYAVSVDSFWELLRAKKDPASCQIVDEVRARCEALVSSLGAHTCYGSMPDSTVTTILMTVLQDQLPAPEQLMTVDHDSLVRALVQAVAAQLLQLVKPHTFLQQVHAGVQLPQTYMDFYLHKQEHYNLKQLLAMLGADALPQLCSASAISQPESSAVATAAALEHDQILVSRPPQQKWVIFTCTTPDLEMGYVLPAGTFPNLLSVVSRICNPLRLCLLTYSCGLCWSVRSAMQPLFHCVLECDKLHNGTSRRSSNIQHVLCCVLL